MLIWNSLTYSKIISIKHNIISYIKWYKHVCVYINLCIYYVYQLVACLYYVYQLVTCIYCAYQLVVHSWV